MNDIQSKIYKYTDLESIPVMDGYSDLVIEDIPGKSWDVYEKDNALCIASFPYIPGGHPNGLLEHERRLGRRSLLDGLLQANEHRVISTRFQFGQTHSWSSRTAFGLACVGSIRRQIKGLVRQSIR